jgi:hypothetical protein
VTTELSRAVPRELDKKAFANGHPGPAFFFHHLIPAMIWLVRHHLARGFALRAQGARYEITSGALRPV